MGKEKRSTAMHKQYRKLVSETVDTVVKFQNKYKVLRDRFDLYSQLKSHSQLKSLYGADITSTDIKKLRRHASVDITGDYVCLKLNDGSDGVVVFPMLVLDCNDSELDQHVEDHVGWMLEWTKENIHINMCKETREYETISQKLKDWNDYISKSSANSLTTDL